MEYGLQACYHWLVKQGNILNFNILFLLGNSTEFWINLPPRKTTKTNYHQPAVNWLTVSRQGIWVIILTYYHYQGIHIETLLCQWIVTLFDGRRVQTESATGSVSSNKIRTTLTLAVENIEFDTQACVLRVKGRNTEENQFVKVIFKYYLVIFDINFHRYN